MKKLILISLILPMIIMGQKLKILKDITIRTELRVGPDTLITYVKATDIYEVIGKKVGWYKIKVVRGSKRVGDTGWVHNSIVKKTTISGIVGLVVIGKGATIRNNPWKSKEDKRYVINGTFLEVLDATFTWYKIKRKEDSKWKTAWVCAMKNYVEVVK